MGGAVAGDRPRRFAPAGTPAGKGAPLGPESTSAAPDLARAGTLDVVNDSFMSSEAVNESFTTRGLLPVATSARHRGASRAGTHPPWTARTPARQDQGRT